MPANPRRSYFDGLAALWDTLPSPPEAPAGVRRFVARAAVTGPAAVLDAGCGTGVLVPAILAACSPSARLVELDLSEQMLRENGRKFAAGRIARVCGDAQALPFPEGAFDLALCFGIVPHLDEPDAALAELLRVLRPGGTIAVGHLMGSRELNEFHAQMDGPVSADKLLPASALAARLAALGARPLDAEEEPGWYFVRAGKAAR